MVSLAVEERQAERILLGKRKRHEDEDGETQCSVPSEHLFETAPDILKAILGRMKIETNSQEFCQ